jgi:hypothetical protein
MDFTGDARDIFYFCLSKTGTPAGSTNTPCSQKTDKMPVPQTLNAVVERASCPFQAQKL